MTTLTHQERARKVAGIFGPHPKPEEPGQDEACQVGRASMARIIARETYPTELVEAVRHEAANCLECQGDGDVAGLDPIGNVTPSRPCPRCAHLRTALALYPDQEEPRHARTLETALDEHEEPHFDALDLYEELDHE